MATEEGHNKCSFYDCAHPHHDVVFPCENGCDAVVHEKCLQKYLWNNSEGTINAYLCSFCVPGKIKPGQPYKTILKNFRKKANEGRRSPPSKRKGYKPLKRGRRSADASGGASKKAPLEIMPQNFDTDSEEEVAAIKKPSRQSTKHRMITSQSTSPPMKRKRKAKREEKDDSFPEANPVAVLSVTNDTSSPSQKHMDLLRQQDDIESEGGEISATEGQLVNSSSDSDESFDERRCEEMTPEKKKLFMQNWCRM